MQGLVEGISDITQVQVKQLEDKHAQLRLLTMQKSEGQARSLKLMLKRESEALLEKMVCVENEFSVLRSELSGMEDKEIENIKYAVENIKKEMHDYIGTVILKQARARTVKTAELKRSHYDYTRTAGYLGPF